MAFGEVLGRRVETDTEPSALRRAAIRVAGCLIGGAVAAAPFALVFGIETAQVHDDLAAIPTTVSAAPGHSQVDFGPAGSFYNPDLTAAGIGLRIEVSNPPDILGDLSALGGENLRSVVQPYVGLYQAPEAAARGYQRALAEDIENRTIRAEIGAGAVLGLAGLAFGALLPAERRRRGTIAVFVGLSVLTGAGAAAWHLDWVDRNAMPSATYPVPGLRGTHFAGTVASNDLLATATQRLAPLVQREVDREQQANAQFLSAAYGSLDRELRRGRFAAPAEGQTTAMVFADLHSSHDMISVYQYLVQRIDETAGPGTIAFGAFAGDSTYGSAAEQDAVDEMGRIIGEGPTYAVLGNHDGTITEKQLHHAKVTVLRGKTTHVPGLASDLSVLGDDDPTLTRVKALFGLGDNVSRNGDGLTEAAAGEKILQTATETHPSLITVHEAYEAAPILGLDQVSPASMRDWFRIDRTKTGPHVDEVPDIPAAAVVYGHWHRKLAHRVVWNSDGSWTLVLELGTAGGAIGNGTPTRFSTPWTVPGQDASAVLLTYDDATGKVVRLQEVHTDTDGTVTLRRPIEIGDPTWEPPVTAAPATPAASPSGEAAADHRRRPAR